MAELYSTPISMLKKGEKNCSRNIWFFYLLNSFRKRFRSWSQNWLYPILMKGGDDLVKGRTAQY